MTVINTNVKSLIAQDAISKNNVALSTAMERLSTGSRINSAKDDAAGLAISTRMTSQVRGLNMAVRNANDGISLMQTSEGAMEEVTSILQRMRELAVQSVNGTNNNSDRVALNDEVTQLKVEIDRIAKTTQFNNQAVLDGSFIGKKLQIGDKAGQTMSVDIASIQTKDLGMSQGSFDSKTLVSSRIALAAVDKGDITINGQALDKITTANDIGDVVKNINLNVDNVVASAFNTVVAKQIGNGITTDGGLTIQVGNIGNLTASTTTYSIKASANMKELVDNINSQANGQVSASINTDGKLVLSNTTGATIKILDTTGTTGSFESGSGFKASTSSGADYSVFTGFLKLDSQNGSPIRIDTGNLGLTIPGALADIGSLGFRKTSSNFSKGVDAYSVTGTALTAAGAAAAWDKNALQINGVNIYNVNITTDSFQGKLDAINNFSDQTGVIAYASLDKTISMSAGDLSGFTAGSQISFNGSIVFSSSGTSTTVASVASAINTMTTSTGITATVSGNNIRLTGTNVQNIQVTTLQSQGTATALFGFTGTSSTILAGIQLDSVKNNPISIALGDTQTADSIGLLEQNVGAADYQVNAPTLGVGAGNTLSGLNISSLDSATAAISTIDNAIEKVSSARSKLGAMENRLNNVVNNLTSISTNTAASRSRIQDTDYATETTALAKSQIISQAATAMLAQANQQPQTVLSLLK